MKTLYTLFFICLNTIAFAQEEEEKNKLPFGITLNTAYSNELGAFRFSPSVMLHREKNQFELGLGFNPFNRNDLSLWSIDLYHKNYPNGRNNKLDLFFSHNISYVKSERNTFFPTTAQYLFVNWGYGAEAFLFSGLYVSSHCSIGTYTVDKSAETPFDGFDIEGLFQSFNFDLAVQFSVGYRF